VTRAFNAKTVSDTETSAALRRSAHVSATSLTASGTGAGRDKTTRTEKTSEPRSPSWEAGASDDWNSTVRSGTDGDDDGVLAALDDGNAESDAVAVGVTDAVGVGVGSATYGATSGLANCRSINGTRMFVASMTASAKQNDDTRPEKM
jgi:hypothetical protein